MNFCDVKAYLLSKPLAQETFPFDKVTHVFKIKGKMFALFGRHRGQSMLTLKCDPDEARALCDIFEGITPGYHMDKRHWISIYFDGSIPDGEVRRLIDGSFNLVVAKLPLSPINIINTAPESPSPVANGCHPSFGNSIV